MLLPTPVTDEDEQTGAAEPKPSTGSGTQFPESVFARFSNWVRVIASHRWFKIAGCAVGIPMLLASVGGAVLYVRYSHLIDERLRAGPFRDSVNIYAAPVANIAWR